METIENKLIKLCNLIKINPTLIIICDKRLLSDYNILTFILEHTNEQVLNYYNPETFNAKAVANFINESYYCSINKLSKSMLNDNTLCHSIVETNNQNGIVLICDFYRKRRNIVLKLIKYLNARGVVEFIDNTNLWQLYCNDEEILKLLIVKNYMCYKKLSTEFKKKLLRFTCETYNDKKHYIKLIMNWYNKKTTKSNKMIKILRK